MAKTAEYYQIRRRAAALYKKMYLDEWKRKDGKYPRYLTTPHWKEFFQQYLDEMNGIFDD